MDAEMGAGALEPVTSPSGPPPEMVPGPAEPMEPVTTPEPVEAERSVDPDAELPDLVLDAAYLVDSTRFETQRIEDQCAVEQGCATGLGERRVVRFGSRMGNVGNADLVLGTPNEQSPPWAQDRCTGGLTLPRFALYELRDSSGRRVLQGTKNAACVTDAEEWMPGSGADCQSYSCGRQGIAPGCADNYGIDLPCQWLDITGVPPGSYELQVTINPDRTMAELDYTNNTAKLRLEITATGGTARL